jgi:hypothetical protein
MRFGDRGSGQSIEKPKGNASFLHSLVVHSGVDCEYWCHPLSALCLRVQPDVFTQPNAAEKNLGSGVARG